MIFQRDSLCLSAVSLSPQRHYIHWPIGKDLDLSFNWGHQHLHLVGIWMISRSADYFIACNTELTRPNKVETAVHGCNSWLSVWTLSCRCPVKLSTWYQPFIVVRYPGPRSFLSSLTGETSFSFVFSNWYKARKSQSIQYHVRSVPRLVTQL